jgi:hypothetical protein
MNILELDSYKLADAVKFNTELNPRIWHNNHMRPEVRAKLLEIAEDFKEFLGLTDLEIKDIVVSGSNASYTYTPHSDIDLHLVADIPQADMDDVYRELFDAKKYQYNDLHDIKIGGYDVELYVENANKPAVSQGNYSLMRDDWNSIPKQRRSTVDDDAVRSKYQDLKHRIDTVISSKDTQAIDTLARKIKSMRQAGLDRHGELGAENLAYKMLRTQGYIRRLYDARAAARDQELSLPEQQRPVTYGFRSQVDEVGLTPDGVNPTTCMIVNEKESMTDQDIVEDFVSYCAQELGLQQVPNIKLRHDPEWSVRHMTFGRYTDELNRLEVGTANRHVMDILRTVAHELVHRRQHETQHVPDTAGHTGSPQENEANARAGILMRGYAEQHPEYFEHGALEESASGYIPTKKQAHDPRYEMALTQDIRPGQVGREANKLKLKTNSQGKPQIARPNGLVETLAQELAAFKSGVITEMDRLGNQRPTGPEFEPEFPAGTVKVDVSDVYDWYKLGQSISNLDDVKASEFGKGPPQTVMAFGSEPEEHKYMKQLKKLGLKLHDIDPQGYRDVDESHELQEQILDEVAMSPGALRAWAASDAAQGIQAGFEAELIFRGLGGEEGEREPNYDEDRPARNISDIVDFFDDNDNNMRSDIRRLENQLREDYTEWLDDQSQEAWSQVQDRRITRWVRENYDPDDEAQEDVTEENPDLDPDSKEFKDAVEARAEQLMDQQIEAALEDPANIYHEAALDDWSEDYYNEDRESEWLEEAGLGYMSAVENNYSITWPYWTSGSREATRDEDEIGASLEEAVDMPVIVSSGYHKANRDPGTWILEPDSSLDPDDDEDGGREIVSPPMPLNQALTKLTAVIDWANNPDQGNAYTNQSTGLHMGVSIPGVGGDVDYTKLILFMGDQYVLQKFGREANTYCKSALKNIQSEIKGGRVDAAQVLANMRQGLNATAGAMVQGNVGVGKYTSAHIKPGYIEFRSPGGDYLAQANVEMDSLENTMLRFARAMQIAGDPTAEREEYAKKLYKLVAPNGNDALKYFSEYAAGKLPKAALKSFVRQVQQQRQVAKTPTGGQKYWWTVGRTGYDATVEVVASTKQEAIALGKKQYPEWDYAQDMTATPLRPYDGEPVPGSTLDLARQRAAAATQYVTNPLWPFSIQNHLQTAAQPQGTFTGRWLIRDTNTGQVLHTISGIGNVQADANRHAAQWAQANAPAGTDMTEIEVVPEMRPVSEDAVQDLEQDLRKPRSYKAIDHVMRGVSQVNRTTPKKLHDRFVAKHGEIPDDWVRKLQEELRDFK